MTWFTASSVTVTNGQLIVSVNAGDDIQLAQESGGLIIGSNPPVEIKRAYLDGSNNKKIELRSAWPYANQTGQPAVAFPTDGDLAAATAVLKNLIDGFALATQAQAEQGTNNTAAMTALRVKQAIDFFRPVTASSSDVTPGRLLKVGDFGLGASAFAPANANALTDRGFYFGPGESGVNYLQGTNYGYIEVKAGRGAQIQQEAVLRLPGVNESLSRGSQDGGDTWSEWARAYNSVNAIGPVLFAGGVNTGSIIERGANANGEYTKFADGTMIASKTELILTNAPPGGEEVYPSWTLPAAATESLFCSVRGQFRAEAYNPATGLYTTHYIGVNSGMPSESGRLGNIGVLAASSALGGPFPPVGSIPSQSLIITRFFFGRWR